MTELSHDCLDRNVIRVRFICGLEVGQLNPSGRGSTMISRRTTNLANYIPNREVSQPDVATELRRQFGDSPQLQMFSLDPTVLVAEVANSEHESLIGLLTRSSSQHYLVL
jgi:hypothetical protein